MTPTQRLAMAEELLEFLRLAQQARKGLASQKGMEAKAVEFVKQGAGIYLKKA